MADAPLAPVPSPTVPAASAPGALATDATWKPEPRQWAWKDVFTSPMLAFKPTCMLISGVTLMLIVALWRYGMPELMKLSSVEWVHEVLRYAGIALSLVIFGLGATLVSVFFKADLLDDEFLSVKEGLKQFASRLKPAVLVPLFLLMTVIGLAFALLYVPGLIGSVPYAGPILYAIFYPIAFALAIFVLLVGIAAVLGLFLFPGIIAIRRHGWFDNVVDTVEAVGTRPHIIIASFVISIIIAWCAQAIAFGGMDVLKHRLAPSLPGDALKHTEQRADEIRAQLDITMPGSAISNHMTSGIDSLRDMTNQLMRRNGGTTSGTSLDNFTAYGPGLVTGLWQTLFAILITGYCMNLLLAGGMLTYLYIREDDYWDDEDLADLDTLAKELEAEAKRESANDSATPPAPAAPPANAPAS